MTKNKIKTENSVILCRYVFVYDSYIYDTSLCCVEESVMK